ncbi:MAG: cbb3-type cytochrome c oxidase subunit I [Acidimicrobiia bacterium]|nr:cbb3-type cytochrome c oxidase subunit I [Acidimicrobiia bacterium]
MTHNATPEPEFPLEVPEDLFAHLPGYDPPPVTIAATLPYLRVALGFLALSLLLGLIAATHLVFPGVFAGVLGYGRIAPIATDMFLFGWLTIGLGGVLLFAVGRLGRVEVANDRLASNSLLLLAGGVLLGSGAVALGKGETRALLEYPLWADAVLLLGMAGMAVVITRTATAATKDPGPVGWYAVAASWWLVLAFLGGNIPGIDGVGGAMQIAFFRSGFTGLWLASAAVGIVYFVIPRVSARPAFAPTRLSLLGFWSLAFVWALTSPATLTFGPVPDWLETVGVVFSIGLMVPVLVIAADLALAVRGRWQVAFNDLSVRFVMLGAALFLAVPALNLMLALRASSGVVQFTDWVVGVDVVAWYGAGTAWLIAAVYRLVPELTGRVAAAGVVKRHNWLTAVGLGVWVFALLTGGVITGWTWVANANEAQIPAAGDGWFNTADAVAWLAPVKLAGFAVYAVAQLLFVAAVSGGRAAAYTTPLEVGAPQPPPDPELVLDRPVTLGRVRTGAVGLLVVVAILVWGIPYVETAGAEPTLLADTSRAIETHSIEARGLEIYIQEGCVACHTQQVRPIVTDVGLGTVSVPGDYAHDRAPLLGTMRIGPDLMHVGSRPPADDPAWVAAHLADPRAERPFSVMPSYDHLSDADLDAVAAYVTSLR